MLMRDQTVEEKKEEERSQKRSFMIEFWIWYFLLTIGVTIIVAVSFMHSPSVQIFSIVFLVLLCAIYPVKTMIENLRYEGRLTLFSPDCYKD